ncbi:MAG TPA: DUF748 domain-containing protein [Dokdonella sp.]
MSRRRFWSVLIAIVVVALIAIRIALPGWATSYLNRRLDRIGDYHGHLDDVDLHLWRGAYSIDGLRIARHGGKADAPPLLDAPHVDLSVSWRALLHGGVVARVEFDTPELNFIDSPSKGDENGQGVDWRKQLESLLPIRLDEVRVNDGRVRFRNDSSNPKVDLQATRVNATVVNLTNVRGGGRRPATLDATGRVLGQAPLEIHANFDPLGHFDDFRFDVKVTDVDLTRANDFLQAYAKLDVESGKGDFVMQLDAHDRQLNGYAKPLFQHVKIFNWKQDVEEQHDNPLRVLWEAFASGVQNLFKNHQEDQFATRIDIHGRIGEANVDPLQAIVAVLRNAFVEAFRPQFEHLPTRTPGDDADKS